MDAKTKAAHRKWIPESVRFLGRGIRAWALSAGLPRISPSGLSPKEQHASGRLSIIVAVHDAPEVTNRCLHSLALFSGDAEVIIVDDGSKMESTRHILDEACSRNGWRMLRHRKAMGHSRASEAGVAASQRPLVCLLNSDTVVTPRSWLGIVEAFDASPLIAAVGPSTSYTPTLQCVSQAMHCRAYWSNQQVWGFAEQYVNRHQSQPLVDLPMIGGFAFFIRRTIWDQFGGFEKKLSDYGNEKELCERLRRKDARIVWTRASYIHHLGAESYGKTLGLLQIEHQQRKADAFIEGKHGAPPKD